MPQISPMSWTLIILMFIYLMLTLMNNLKPDLANKTTKLKVKQTKKPLKW